MMKYTKQEAVMRLVLCAKKYKENLEGHQIIFLLKDKHKKVSHLEVKFQSYNFLHLTGIKLNSGITARDFYKRCLTHKLSLSDFDFSADGTTQLKLEILPTLMTKNLGAKMVGDFYSKSPKLYTEKLAGGVKACLGFTETEDIYVPNTVLNVDIREVSKNQRQVIAAYRKKINACTYTEVIYKAKKISWDELVIPAQYADLINLLT